MVYLQQHCQAHLERVRSTFALVSSAEMFGARGVVAAKWTKGCCLTTRRRGRDAGCYMSSGALVRILIVMELLAVGATAHADGQVAQDLVDGSPAGMGKGQRCGEKELVVAVADSEVVAPPAKVGEVGVALFDMGQRCSSDEAEAEWAVAAQQAKVCVSAGNVSEDRRTVFLVAKTCSHRLSCPWLRDRVQVSAAESCSRAP